MASCPQFVAHPNVQQLLASIWYEGLPGFRQKNMLLQVRLISPCHNLFKQQRAFNLKLQGLEVCRMGLLFPVFSVCYIVTPWWSFSQTMRKPFIKFICNSSSYFTFLCKSNCHWEWVVRAFALCLLGLHKRLLVFWLEFLLLFHTPINSSLNEIINQVSHARRSQYYLLGSFAHPGLAADRGHRGLGPDHRHHQARLPPLGGGVLHPRLGSGPHLEWDQAALGCRAQGKAQYHFWTQVLFISPYSSHMMTMLISGVREWPVECCGLCDQFSVCRHHRAQDKSILWRKLPSVQIKFMPPSPCSLPSTAVETRTNHLRPDSISDRYKCCSSPNLTRIYSQWSDFRHTATLPGLERLERSFLFGDTGHN